MSEILYVIGFFVLIFLGGLPAYVIEKKNEVKIEALEMRLSVLDGGGSLLKIYVRHCNEVRIKDLNNRLSNLEQLGLIRFHPSKELEDIVKEQNNEQKK